MDRPDPASHFQPQGVHGPSQVIDHSTSPWQDAGWKGVPLAEMIFYELHVGTFTPAGTFAAIIPRLPDLVELGVNAIELMPVAQFPGDRNWGYDGVYPFAVQNSYGGPLGLKQLVDACHQQGLAVILDVVYNHFGPEGNYTSNFGPYGTATYQTPWGTAMNFDHARSDGVRNYFIQNALHWLEHYHLDGLRLDAIHAIYDLGAKHFLPELAERVDEFSRRSGRKRYLIAESDLNDVRVIRDRAIGGHGMDAQWSDDFHHALHALLTGEQLAYYQDFGRGEDLVKAYKQPFVYDWKFSRFRQRYHGSDASRFPSQQFIICIQNHDQVGNRMLGERLSHLVDFSSLKLAAAALLMAPNIPLLFMGEEYGETAPFLYFVSHSDPELVEAVRRGRKAEFADFHLEGKFQDPLRQETFVKSQLQWQQRQQGQHQILLAWYRRLIQLRRTLPALKPLNHQQLEITWDEVNQLLQLHRWGDGNQILAMLNFKQQTINFTPYLTAGNWSKILDAAASEWQGPGSTLPEILSPELALTMPGRSFALFNRI